MRSFGRPVQFVSRGSNLSGELLIPNGPGPFPALVMLHGAGWGQSCSHFGDA